MMDAADLQRQEEDFFQLFNKIMEQAEEKGITLRVLGAIAFRIHCPKHKRLHYELGRELSDIDFAGYLRDIEKIEELFLGMGYQQDEMVKRLFGTKRRIFFHPDKSIHSDVFIDKLRFCHEIDFQNRLELDYPTIPLVDMLLEKMQIVQLTEKDIIDTIMLLREHEVGASDNETVNSEYLATLCSKDWGLWRTVTMNLEKTKNFLPQYDALQHEDRRDVEEKIEKLLSDIESKPKSLRWKMRAKIGDKVQWYRDVEEVTR
ncbi:MAG: hypothetical protein ACE5OW_01755 [Candidatus Bathyarchaeia archaeon]